ncbi:MAG TPA: protease complex subunit PrcB family protein [Pyrinomonadaceae bacterium]|nr:protease complex subunit PrcB family protein [Pyrinomonadaceae bacterium]
MVRKFFGRALVLAALALHATATASACAVAPGNGANGVDQSKRKRPTPEPSTPQTRPSPPLQGDENLETKPAGEIRELAAGGYSSVRESFVAVARDAETYKLLRRLHDKLPELGADFFKTNAVVAAFLGQRRSGGYAVQITGAGGARLRIMEKSPPKDAMTTMAITAAFQVVSIALDEEMPLALELDATWQNAARPYKVSAGQFTRLGGFAGRPERSTLAGDIHIMRHNDLATAFFALEGRGEEGKYALQDVTTATVAAEGALNFARLDPGSFVPPPRNPLRVRGQFTDNEGKLSLTLEAMEAKVNDGYGGQGKLEAAATAPPPQKRAIDGDDPM